MKKFYKLEITIHFIQLIFLYHREYVVLKQA
jgi:hypothetical protein